MVAHNCHGKIFLLTAKSIFATAKSFSSRQNQFHHGKVNFSMRQNQFHNTAKSVSSRQNHFHPRQNHLHPRRNKFHHGKIIFIQLAHVTLARKVLWESIQHGGVPRVSITQHVLLQLWK